MFKDILKSIMNDLERISKIDKNALLRDRIKHVIEASNESYCNMLKINYDYLLYRDTLKVIKTIKREKTKESRKNEV